MRRISVIAAILFLLAVSGCTSDKKEQLTLDEVDTVEEEQAAEDSIFVYVCGAVNEEGVYELPAGSRAYEAIQKAGGFSTDAAVTQMNQAEVLEDEARLYIPTISEMEDEHKQEDGKVNLNTASKEEFMTLPGVGESKAELIVRYREEHGSFQTIEDIMNISGIKEGLFGRIKDYIKV